MDNALHKAIGDLCKEANRGKSTGGHASLFYFSEEGTVAKWESNVGPMYCIRKWNDRAFEHFVPEKLVAFETLRLLDRVYKHGHIDGEDSGKENLRTALRQIIGLDSRS